MPAPSPVRPTRRPDDPQRCPRRRARGVGRRALPPPACWPTGAPTSSRSSRRRAIRSAACSAPSGPATQDVRPAVRGRQPRQAQRRPRPPQPTPAARRWSGCSRGPTCSSPTCGWRRSSASGSTTGRSASAIPRLIYGIITGYGLDGPDAHRPGYDVGAFWARSSLAVVGRAAGHAAAADPQRPRRPRHRHDAGRGHLRRAVRPRAHRRAATSCRRACCAAGLYCGGVGPRRAAALRPAGEHAAPREAQDAARQLLRRRRRQRASGCSGWRPIATGRASSRRSSGPTWRPTSGSPAPGRGCSTPPS